MVYIRRDKSGKICAVFSEKTDEAAEEVEIDSPEFVDFLMRCDVNLQMKFLQSDLQMIRVLEDVIDILMDKNIVTITDFPQPVMINY